MAGEINLFTTEKKLSFQKSQFVRLAKVGSLVLLIFYLVASLGVFSFWFYIREESQRISREITIKREKIASLEKIESLQVLLKERLSSLKAIFEERPLDYKGFLIYLTQLSSAEIGFKDIAISQSGDIVLSGEAINGHILANFLDQISGDKENDLLRRIVLSSVSRHEDGGYSFSLNFYLKDGV